MTFRFISNVINTGLTLWLVWLIIHLLRDYALLFTKRQRAGLGLWGGGVMMSIAGIWANGAMTPYSVWYTWVWRLGCGLFLSGLAVRLRRHHDGNEAQMTIAREHFRTRPARPPQE